MNTRQAPQGSGWQIIVRKRRRSMRSCRTACIGLLVLLLHMQTGMAVEPPAADVWLLSSQAGGDYQEVADAFMQRLAAAPAPQPKVRLIIDGADKDALSLKPGAAPPALIVAIGGAAARLAETLPRKQPVLDILVPRLLFEQLTTANSARSALYIDQPFARQLNLCRLIVPDLHQLAVLYGPVSQNSDRDLRSAAKKLDISLVRQYVRAGENPNAALDQVLDGSQLLLALPDPDVFNRYTVAGLLLTAYHHDVPIIGFSAAYVKAGAIAAVYSTPEQIGRQAAEMVLAAKTAAGWALPAPRYPTDFNVAVNRQVGRSLNMKLPDEVELQQALVHEERTQR